MNHDSVEDCDRRYPERLGMCSQDDEPQGLVFSLLLHWQQTAERDHRFYWSPSVGDSLLLQSATGVKLIWFCCHLVLLPGEVGEISDLSSQLFTWNPSRSHRAPLLPSLHVMKNQNSGFEISDPNLAWWCILFSLGIHFKK